MNVIKLILHDSERAVILLMGLMSIKTKSLVHVVVNNRLIFLITDLDNVYVILCYFCREDVFLVESENLLWAARMIVDEQE